MPATPKNNGQTEQAKNYWGFALTREPYHFPAANTASTPQKDQKENRQGFTLNAVSCATAGKTQPLSGTTDRGGIAMDPPQIRRLSKNTLKKHR